MNVLAFTHAFRGLIDSITPSSSSEKNIYIEQSSAIARQIGELYLLGALPLGQQVSRDDERQIAEAIAGVLVALASERTESEIGQITLGEFSAQLGESPVCKARDLAALFCTNASPGVQAIRLKAVKERVFADDSHVGFPWPLVILPRTTIAFLYSLSWWLFKFCAVVATVWICFPCWRAFIAHDTQMVLPSVLQETAARYGLISPYLWPIMIPLSILVAVFYICMRAFGE